MQNKRVVNAVIFAIIYLMLAPFLGGLLWSAFMINDAISQSGKPFGMAHINLIYITIITSYKHLFFPALFAGLFGGWWRKSFSKFSNCFLMGIFAAFVLTVFKYFELVVINTPYMQATNWQYLQIILYSYALPAFIISTFLAYIARERIAK